MWDHVTKFVSSNNLINYDCYNCNITLITLVLFSVVSSVCYTTVQKFAIKAKNCPNLKQCIKVKSREAQGKSRTPDFRSTNINTIYADIYANLSYVEIAKLLYFLFKKSTSKLKAQFIFLLLKLIVTWNLFFLNTSSYLQTSAHFQNWRHLG